MVVSTSWQAAAEPAAQGAGPASVSCARSRPSRAPGGSSKEHSSRHSGHPSVFSTTDVLYFSRPTWITVYASLVLPAPELLPRSPRARSTVTWTCVGSQREGPAAVSAPRTRAMAGEAATGEGWPNQAWKPGPSEKLGSGGGRSGSGSERRRRPQARPPQLRAGLGRAEPAAASPPPGCRPRRDVSAPPPAPPSGRRPATRDLTRTRAEVRQSLGMVARTPSPRLLQTSLELQGR